MKVRKNWTTKGLGFFLQLAAVVFIIVLMISASASLAPVTESRIEDCQSRLERWTAEKEAAGTEDEIEKAEYNVRLYTNRITMLENRDKIYKISMVFLACVLLAGAALQCMNSATFSLPGSKDSARGVQKYYPFLSAPLTATCVLLAIGVTYQLIFSWEFSDFVILMAAVLVGIIAFLLYRRAPFVSAKLQKHRLGKGGLTFDDLVFMLPAVATILLIAALFMFGKEVYGAKICIVLLGREIHPSEVVKVLLLLMFAASYGKMWRAIFSVAVGGVAVLGFLLLKDMGTAIVIFAMVLTVLFLLLDNKMTFSLFEHKKMLVIILFLAICLFIVALAFFPHAQQRIVNVGTAMTNEDSMQQREMLRAMIFGGLGGLGLEQSTYIINIFAISSDMALTGLTAIFGYGMLLIVLLCFATLIIVPMRKFSLYRPFYFASAQFSVVLFVQVLFNALGAADALPFTGIVAPFISAGGVALICFGAMVGIMMATLYPLVKPLEVQY